MRFLQTHHVACHRLVSLALVLALLTVAAASTHVRAAPAAQPAPPKIIFVNHAAAPGGNGSSWANAFKFLQDGLAAAASGDEIGLPERAACHIRSALASLRAGTSQRDVPTKSHALRQR